MPDNTIEQWTYNGNGDVTKYTSPFSGGQAYDIDYVFDDAGQLTTVDYDTGTDTTFTYDDSGRRTQMVDSTGTTTWTYNAANELTQFVSPQGTVNRTYNADGALATMVDVGTGTTSYTYSSTTGQLTQLQNPHNEITKFFYDSLGRLQQKELHSGMEEVYGYDARNRVTSLTTRTSGQTTRLAQTYTYDDASNVLTHTKGSDTTTYTYDDIGQFLTESRTGYSASYTYDANGNRATRTVGGVTETFHNDAGDKLTHITIGGSTVKSFVYDAAGRTTRVTQNSQHTDVTYDFESRITQITGPGISASYSYNGLDTRISKTENSVSNTFRRAGAYVTNPVLGDGAATFTPGVSERRGSTTTYAHHGLKNMEAQSQSGQTLTGTRQYDAFGNVTSGSGWQGQFGYAGGFGYQEDASGLRLLGHRYYDATTGRFLTRDPIKDGRNWYVYCEGNPLGFSDPNGLSRTTLHSTHGLKFLVETAIEEAIASGIEYGIQQVKQGIYVIEHDGRVYVGQSGNLDDRLKDHKKRFGNAAENAIRIEVPHGLNGRDDRTSREFWEQLVLDHYKDKGVPVENIRNPVGPKRRPNFFQAVGDWIRQVVF